MKCRREVKVLQLTRTNPMRISRNRKSQGYCVVHAKMAKTTEGQIIRHRNFQLARRHHHRITMKVKFENLHHKSLSEIVISFFIFSFQLMNLIVCLRHRQQFQLRQLRPEARYQHQFKIQRLPINNSQHKIRILSSFTHASGKSKRVESHQQQALPISKIQTRKMARRRKAFIHMNNPSPTAIKCISIYESKSSNDIEIFTLSNRDL